MTGKFYSALAPRLTVFEDGMTRSVVAIIILFVLTLLVVGFCGRLIQSLVRKAGLSGTDRLLGVGFGAVRGVLVVCALLAVLQILFSLNLMTGIAETEAWQGSRLIPELSHIVQWFFSNVNQHSLVGA